MKRNLFVKVAISLGVAATGIALPATAQVALPTVTEAMSALKTGGSTVTNYGQDGTTVTGIVNTEASGGKVGTFTASGSQGDSQRFAVGTSTSFGVNASGSSTAEYAVDSQARMALGGSNFSQTIGSSGSNLDARSSESLRESYVMNEVETTIGSSAQSSYEREQASGSSRYGHSWWSPTSSWNTLTTDQKSEYESSYDQERTSISESAASTYNSSESVREAANGVISGSFKANSSASDSSANPLTSTDNNDVTVKGIGNSANLRAGSNSLFDVKVQARTMSGLPDSNSATANGAAGANMSSTSSADASTTSFSSLFIQSF